MNGSERIFTFFKGRVALHAILEAAGIGPGDKVILPGYTCVVVPNAILYRGAQPVYVDIDPADFNMDTVALQECVNREADDGKLKAIIAQHTYGLPADMPRILELARPRGLLVIEDACHALGSTLGGQPVGTFGQASFFSSQWSKPLTTGLGGWARINRPELADGVATVSERYPRPSSWESLFLHWQYLAYRAVYSPRMFWRIQGAYRKLGALGLVSGSSNRQELDCLQPGDYHKRMGTWQNRVLSRHLDGLERLIAARRSRGQAIEAALRGAGLPFMTVPPAMDPVWLRYPLRVANKSEVLATAREHRVELGDWFLSPIHPNLEDWERAGYQPGSCPAAETAAREVVNIPTSPTMSDGEVLRTVEFLVRFAEPVLPRQDGGPTT